MNNNHVYDMLVHTEDPEHCLRRLVDISVSRGAPDNITAILMQNI